MLLWSTPKRFATKPNVRCQSSCGGTPIQNDSGLKDLAAQLWHSDRAVDPSDGPCAALITNGEPHVRFEAAGIHHAARRRGRAACRTPINSGYKAAADEK